MTDSRHLISLDSSHALAIPERRSESAASRSPDRRLHIRRKPEHRDCPVLISCPICGSGILNPLSDGKAIYLLEGNEPRALGKPRTYICGSNEHMVIVPAEANGISQISASNGASAALDKKNVLNSWKEVATYMGRGVRTVQRWEQELGLPIRRPRGKSRSAVVALAPDLDEWLRRAPVGFEPGTNGNVVMLNPEHSSAPDETERLNRKHSTNKKRPGRRSIA
jgi:hypothetical protein